jgi:hypothetical protein
MSSQQAIYNSVLGELGSRSLASLSENRESKRVLDAYWADEVAYCIAQGQWLFAKRRIQIDADSSGTPAFGYNNRFVIPNDWVRTTLVSSLPGMDPPLQDYEEQTGYWYAQVTPLYVDYISNDPQYGMNLGAWPESFNDYVVKRLARKACLRLTQDQAALRDLVKEEDRARRVAKANDALNDPPTRPPMGWWARSRRGNISWGFGAGGNGNVNTGPIED